ncbi:nuclear RNA export factor 1 [Drosophila virilis]|uniref:NTF2 domain-containing protein n=1 Tax=Drosophila virilis TaxID=7244 RepID=A0A0Q9WXW1_DROVI|nr:nuclear RNA export factor 1 [Drosophila virilis]KRF85248.1 uncharacterized protein Dvir_GJ27063 [Drosophila virilis]
MSVFQKLEENGLRNGRRINMKTRTPVNILKASNRNLGSSKFKEYVGVWIGDLTPVHLCNVLDKYVQEHDTKPKMINVTGWFTVTISNCMDLPDSSIMLALKYAMMPLKVQLYNFKRSHGGDCGQFLVDTVLMANRLKRLSGKVSVLFSSQIINIIVEQGMPSNMLTMSQFTPELLVAIRTALFACYEADSATLNLSRFHAVAELEGHFCPLHVLPMLQQVLFMISQQFPLLRILQLRDNFLCTLRAFNGFSRANMPALQNLDVSANQIQDLMELKNLRNLDLQTLKIAGNPLAKYQPWQLNAMLPQGVHICGYSQKLQSQELIRAPSPSAQGAYSINCEGFTFCAGFAKVYYNIFDETSRRPELDIYYDAKALFSFSAPTELTQSLQCNSSYRLFNRNHLHLRSSFARCGKMRVGGKNVVQTICKLPDMQTSIEEARLEVHIYNNKLRAFTLTGSCSELTTNNDWQRRIYSRSFVMRPDVPPRWVITNDMLNITLGAKQEVRCKRILVPPQAMEAPLASQHRQGLDKSCNIDDQLEEISNGMPKLAIEPKKSFKPKAVLPSFEEMPQLVTQASVDENIKLEREVDDTLLCSEDEMLLVISDDVL